MIGASDKFHKAFGLGVTPLDWAGKISFNKKRRQDVSWFILGQSQLDGGDLLATLEQNPTQIWDAYEYQDISERLLEVEIDRSVNFPHNVQASVADITLDNHDGFWEFDGEGAGENANFILPKRPLRLYMGAKNAGRVPVFVGVTQKIPQYDKGGTATWAALDFLSEIAESDLRNTFKMRDVTTDQVIAKILEQYGMDKSQYSLQKGANTIPFVFFEKGANAGNILKKLVQAENGALWLDEQGIIRFETRSGIIGRKPVMVLSDKNIIESEFSQSDKIINRVRIKSQIRKVQPFQPVFSIENQADAEDWQIKAGGKNAVWLKFDDPVESVRDLVLNGEKTGSNFTAKNLSGVAVNDRVSVKLEMFHNSAKVTFINQNMTPVYIASLELWGEPAKVVDEIDYEAKNPESIERFGDNPLEITDNHFFGSYANCRNFARDVLNKMSDFSPTVELDIIGNPALQIGDIVSIEGEKSGDYIVTGITVSMGVNKGMTMRIRGRRHHTVEPFTLDKSILDGKDVLG